MMSFLTPGFGLSALAVYALVTALKRILRVACPKLAGKVWFRRAVLANAPLLFGAWLGLIPDLLPGETPGQQVMTGVVAGLLSGWVFSMVRKRTPDSATDDPAH